MPEIIETIVYQLHELGPRAKAEARDWYRQRAYDHDWFEFAYDDFEEICVFLGITLARRSVRLFGGGTRGAPQILFSGFSSQGDGACFEGTYRYARDASANLKAHAPKETWLHMIADQLQTLQQHNFYQLRADIRHRGRYYHEYCMDITVERSAANGQEMTADADEALIELFRDLARWLYRRLEREYDDLNSDEVVDEGIRANEYTFTETGRRFG